MNSPTPGFLSRFCSRLRSYLVAGALLSGASSAMAQCQPQWLPGDGVPGVGGDSSDVRATTTWDPDGAGPATPLLVVAGSFPVAGNVFASNIATYDPLLGTWTALGSGVNGTVRALTVLPNGDLVAGGSFTTAGGFVSAYVARYVSTCAATASATAPGCPSSGGSNTPTATNLPWTGSTFHAQGTGMPLFAFIGVVTGFSTVSLPLSSVWAQGQPGCNLAVSADVVDCVVSNGGAATALTALPNTPSLAGIVCHQQMIPFEVDLSLNFTAITATNALAMTVGSF